MRPKKLKDKIHLKLINFVFYLTDELGWHWLGMLISLLAEAEVYWHLVKNKEFKENLDLSDICISQEETSASKNIPDDPLYCDSCPYLTYSKIAKLFYGAQMSGYCYYLGKGDFTFSHPTELLWDGCKECQVNIDWDEFEEDYELNSTIPTKE